MIAIKSWIGAAAVLGMLLAGCAAQPIPSPTPADSTGQPAAYPNPSLTQVDPTGQPAAYLNPADPTAEANGVPVSSSGGSGNGSLQTPEPGQTPTSPAPGESEGIVLTLQDSGHTLALKQGQTFLVKLGEGYDWQIIIADQSVVSRVKNVMVIRGAQGLYTALQPGQTEFSAQGDPLCRSAKPACMLPSILFRQTLIVE